MYQINSNLPVNGTHWGLIFVDGIATTDSQPLAERLARRGYTVQEIAPEQPEQEQNDNPVAHVCPKCGKECKSPAGLTKHMEKCEG